MLFAYGFVGLTTIFSAILPVALSFLLGGIVWGIIFAVAYAMMWLFIMVRLVRIRRRRFGRFWPAKEV